MIFAVNTTQKDLMLILNNDVVLEQVESFFVDLSSLNGTLCDTTAVLILDDDQLSITPRKLIAYDHNRML